MYNIGFKDLAILGFNNQQKSKKKYSKAEYVQRRVRFVNKKLSLHVNVVFSACERMGNAAYITFIMWNSISGLYTWYNFRFREGVKNTQRGPQNPDPPLN